MSIVIGQVAKKTAQKSKTLLSDIERWQKVHAYHSKLFFWNATVAQMIDILFVVLQGVASSDGKLQFF